MTQGFAAITLGLRTTQIESSSSIMLRPFEINAEDLDVGSIGFPGSASILLPKTEISAQGVMLPEGAGSLTLTQASIGARGIVTGTGTAPTFQDFFASGDLSHSENNWGWLDNSGLNASVTVVADNPVPGLGSSYSCRFTYVGVANCTDNRPELRLTYNGNSESWGGNGPAEAFFEFYHYYPDGTESWGGAQYSHRTQVGCADATNNNKWIIMGGNQSSGPIKWIESEAASGGESFLTMKNRHLSGGDAQSNPNSEDGSKGIHSGMYGQWTRWNWQVRVPSGSGNTDGLQRLWRDGVLWKDGNGTASEEQGSGFGELTAHGYFFGASNSGFSSTTYIFLGGVRIWFNSSLGQSAPTGWPNPL